MLTGRILARLIYSFSISEVLDIPTESDSSKFEEDTAEPPRSKSPNPSSSLARNDSFNKAIEDGNKFKVGIVC